MSTKSKQTVKTMQLLEKISGEPLILGSLLRAISKGEELSQASFAEKLNVSKQYICDIELRRRFVSLKAAYQYAGLLGYSPEQFVRLALQDRLDNANIPYMVDVRDAE